MRARRGGRWVQEIMDDLVNQAPLQTHLFGSTHQKVTRTGLGGEGVLRTQGCNSEARKVIQDAIAQGINYFDSARVYADSELYYGYIWKDQPGLRAQGFQASKSPGRGPDSRAQLPDPARERNRPHE